MTYATRDEVLERIGHAGSSNADLQSRVDDALDAATTEIENDTNRIFAQSSTTRTFAVPDRYVQVMDVPDLRSINTLKFDDDDDGVFEVTITDFELDQWINRPGWAFDRLRLTNRYFPPPGKRRRRIEIDAEWGWTAVPATINQACSLLAARLAQRPSVALFGVQSFSDDGGQAIMKDHDYWRLIDPYKLTGVA